MRPLGHSVISASVSLASLFVSSISSAAAVVPISPIIQDPVTGLEYQLLSNAGWTDSEAEAQLLGGNLATISNQEQQKFVFGTFGGYSGKQRILWTGLYDPTQDKNGAPHVSDFVWVSGAPVTYTNWDAGEPNDVGGVEFYVAMYYPNYHNPGSWNDWSNRTADPIGVPFHGVVEFLPGDADDDGSVGFDDLLIVARNYDKGGGWTQGDFNGDGAVGFDDLLIVARNYGATLTSSQLALLDPAFRADEQAAFTEVPEAGAAATAPALFGLLIRRRKWFCVDAKT